MCIRWLTYVGMGVLAYVGMGGLPELLNSPIGIRRRLRKGSLSLSALILSQIKAFDKALRGVDEEPGKMAGSDLEGAFYESEIEAMRPIESNTMFIDFSHVMCFNDLLQKAISDEYLRLESYLKNACKRFVMEQKPTFITDDNPNKDVNVAFFNLPLMKRLRDLATADIGKLVSVSGVVTCTSEVRPELLQGTFKCLECGNVIKNVEQQFKYTEIGRWLGCRKPPKKSPQGRFPDHWTSSFAMTLVLFTGTVVVIPDIMALASPGDRAECRREASQRKDTASGNEGVRGLRALGVRDLSYHLAFIANSVQVSDGRRDTDIRNRKKDADDEGNQQFMPEELDEVQRMRNTPDFFNKLVDNIVPTVFGHQDIKRAILLMLLGVVHKATHEGVNLRGDINVCIVGDPSCAKSQFLKYGSSLVPRSVYTSGKSSLAAGLTATVAKEPETGEFCIEVAFMFLFVHLLSLSYGVPLSIMLHELGDPNCFI
ncbi:hypothetical protein RHGRI_026593 [Rhododendron griersonianum]|uniref:DNA helicase n=1 Tax=Rhododendron griersonianum TaxID=479676 RepID=A0AAV6IXT8_9ERIC|nr:hypothetical protein RHGRI_026593 [Rhododendron griersonianum]